MTPTVEHALSIVGLVVVTCWFITLGIAGVLWVREDLRQHRARKRAEQLFVPEEWLPFEDRRIRPGTFVDWAEHERFEEMEW
jgi:hypothetical protein